MKAWFLQLSIREKYMVGGITVIFSILLLYYIVWRPVATWAVHTKQTAADNRELLAWMQQADSILKHAGTSSQPTSVASPNNRLVIIQQSIEATSFAKNIKKLGQNNTSDITITLSNASFDDINTWLIMLWRTHGIALHDASFRKTHIPGKVNATLTLGGSS